MDRAKAVLALPMPVHFCVKVYAAVLVCREGSAQQRSAAEPSLDCSAQCEAHSLYSEGLTSGLILKVALLC